MTKIGGRKFLVTLVIVVLTAILAVGGWVSTEVATIFTAAVTSFNAGNAYVTGKYADKRE